MPMQSHSFKRLVLGLQLSPPDHAVRLAAELAELLHLELLGLFLEDTGLRHLAGMPFARELRLLGGGWHQIAPEQLSLDLELAVRSAERMFAEAAKQLPIQWYFEVVRGPIATSITTISQKSDIVMIIEPVSAAERVSQQFFSLSQAAFRSAAAVIFVPANIVRAKGPIVAIVATPDHPSLAAAAAIALAADEELFVLDICKNGIDDASIDALATDKGLAIKHVVASKVKRSDAGSITQALHSLQERLVVMTRGAFDGRTASTIASERRVPVMIVEPLEGA